MLLTLGFGTLFVELQAPHLTAAASYAILLIFVAVFYILFAVESIYGYFLYARSTSVTVHQLKTYSSFMQPTCLL